MGTKAVERGPVSEAVASNVKAVRERRRLTQQQLAARLAELGRPMQPSAVAKVEAGARRVDVDDLVAFAVALNVSPARLLVPDVHEDEEVHLLPDMPVPAWSAWGWATGRHSLSVDSDDLRNPVVQEREMRYADERPVWERTREQHPLMRAARRVGTTAERALGSLSATSGGRGKNKVARELLRRVEQSLDGVRREVDAVSEELSSHG